MDSAQKFLSTIEKFSLLRKKEKLLVGVSGGPDSIFLIEQLRRIQKPLKLTLICAHLNHALRAEADQDARFVEDYCVRHRLYCVSEKRELTPERKKDSLEQAARRMRYDFFRTVSRRMKLKKIVLAHHRDDLVETVVMRLIRGAGLKGLRGFLPRSRYKNLTVIRPLIEFQKREILDWLAGEGVPYCVDRTNFEDMFTRNKIRNRVLPLLEEMNPNFSEVMSNQAIHLGFDYDYIRAQTERAYQEVKRGETRREVRLGLGPLKKLHPSLFAHVLRLGIEDIKGDTRRIENRHLEEMKDLILRRSQGSVVHLPFLEVRKSGRLLIIRNLIL
ncbi:MAG: tRNA lysidine(34) synthetase TilS [Candidatus Omnitrophica bacterium]|nr:tRNA lysidine(34) synthetase TilS [Candidatus Omnitrophota bacterium]